MHNFRRLPLLLWVLWSVGLFAMVTSLAIPTWTIWPLSANQGLGISRVQTLALPLGMLGFASNLPVFLYAARQRFQAKGQPHWLDRLDRWPGQLLAAVVPGALPAVALAIVLLVPSNSPLFSLVWPLGYLSAIVLLITFISGLVLAVL
jgi:hypothetical protein